MVIKKYQHRQSPQCDLVSDSIIYCSWKNECLKEFLFAHLQKTAIKLEHAIRLP